MAFTQQQFATGDTDYIAKLNANAAAVAAAINQLQLATGSSGATSSVGPALYLDAVFSKTTTLIGVTSYVPTPSGNNLNFSAGGAYRAGSSTVVSLNATTSVGFVGASAGTYYIALDGIGVPIRATATSVDAIYSVVWTGVAFSVITRLVKIAFNALEESDSRISSLNGSYINLDGRMEAIELALLNKLNLAQLSTAINLGGVSASDSLIPSQKAAKTYTDGAIASLYTTVSDEFGDVSGPAGAVNMHLAVFDGTTGKLIKDGGAIPAVASSGSYHDLTNRPSRKVGVTIDGGGAAPLTGVKGAIQIDFTGTITGWSIIADQPGSIDVEVSIKRTSPPTAPPAAPLIPDPVTDKISADAPIQLVEAQSASAVAANVITWDTLVMKWDVVQFNVSSAEGLIRAVLYIVIEEL